MTIEKNTKKPTVRFRQVTERFCSQIGDNVVVMQTVTDDSETFSCMNSASCPNSYECRNNFKS
ncbi:MAG: hypothetical protein IKV53_02265 [Clostridia bacterium]|nr:hypothetical protein [Clostridia bacterium]